MKNLALFYATAMAAAHSLANGYIGPFDKPAFNGNKRCKNCRKPTMSSEFCDLRCVCAYKAKQREKEGGKQ
jgi:hypothetical protein